MRNFFLLVLFGAVAGCSSGDSVASTGASAQVADTGAGVLPSEDPYIQWWDPACVSDGKCSMPHCGPVRMIVSPVACGTSTEVYGGCLYQPAGVFTSGWQCYRRGSDGAIIQTESTPIESTGLQTCAEAGVNGGGNGPPVCPDAGP
jgi:hypothetical protein